MKKDQVVLTDEDILVDLICNNIPASLLAEFAEKIMAPSYNGNVNAAVKDLLQKAIGEQDFVLSHIIHVRNAGT